MCRIAGIVSQGTTPARLEDGLRQMCGVQRHGGPDDEGIFVDEERAMGLGHRRLSLIDLSPGGHQPMFYNDRNLVITYNGELYNYTEIRTELRQVGYRFASASDTEVILAAFQEWGAAAFKRFKGMFAFALLDKKSNQIFLVRDPSGIKPLYYATVNGQLAFASEVRALHQLQALQEPHPHWKVYFLAYGHLPEPVTVLKHVKPVPKGCYLVYNVQNHEHRLEPFGHFTYLEKTASDAGAVRRAVRNGLTKAVQSHLISDAPVGSFLSGGIDSSVVTLLAGEAVKENLNTLSIYFDEGVYSEQKYQDIIRRQLSGNHGSYKLTAADFAAHLPAVVDAMDLPSSDGINTWFISKYAKEQGLKAVLSGVGGDELFGGYPSFERIKSASYLQQLPNATLRAGRHSQQKQFRRLPFLSLPGIKGKYLFLRGHFVPLEIARQLNADEGQVWQILEEQPVMPRIEHLTYKNQASWMEMHLYMQNQLLRDSDVMSMAHGIEIRVPFLDVDFVKLVLQIQSSIKYAGGGKRLLIEAFEDKLPSEIYNRPKMGFSFPFKEWMAENEWIKEVIQPAPKEAQRVYAEFLQGRRHWSQALSMAIIQHYDAVERTAVAYA